MTEGMTGGAQLVVSASWDGRHGCVTAVRCQILPVARLLRQRTLAEVLSLVPSLYSLCAHVQFAVARAALQSAVSGHAWREPAPVQRVALALEATRELLWRILLDWPTLHGAPTRRVDYAGWHRRLAASLSGLDVHARSDELTATEVQRCLDATKAIGQQLLDGRLSDFLPDGCGADARSACLGDLLAMDELLQLNPLADLPASAVASAGPAPECLPSVDAAQWLAGFGGVPDEAFCRAPTWQGRVMESGAWARQREHASVRALSGGGNRLAARLLAQLVDLAAWASVLVRPDAGALGLCSAACSDGVGLASCESARGTLVHVARVDARRVADYAVIAPTDWNFGAQAAVLNEGGFIADSEAGARRFLTALVLAFNPCVPFEIRLERQ